MSNSHAESEFDSRAFDGARVLVVMPEGGEFEGVAERLRQLGADVFEAASRADAFEILEQICPDVVVFAADEGAPGGVPFASEVRAFDVESGGLAPVIAVTRGGAAGAERAAATAGADMLVAWPLDPSGWARLVSDMNRARAAVRRISGELRARPDSAWDFVARVLVHQSVLSTMRAQSRAGLAPLPPDCADAPAPVRLRPGIGV